MVPHNCRNGSCGSCKAKLIEGAIRYDDEILLDALTDDEKNQGHILLCCAKPASDHIVLAVDQARRASSKVVRKLPCRIESLNRVSEDIMILQAKLPTQEHLDFYAGQYIDILMKDGRRRSFSLANSPQQNAMLELHIRHVIGGAFTDKLFNEFKGKEILRFEGPFGHFKLNEESDKPLIFLATGTGFAPIQSIIEDMLTRELSRSITLYWGIRKPSDIYAMEQLGKWQHTYHDFTCIPVLSKPLDCPEWQGRTGYVHHALMEDFADLSGYEVYASGNPNMIDDAKHLLIHSRGLESAAFFSDAFYSAAPREGQVNL